MQILISDSKFNNNQYTSSFDGSGIGFYSEDYSENLEKSYHLHIVFSGCQFNENGDASDANSAGVFGWSRGTSIISFVDCQFKSNKVSLSSSLINIQNGCFLDISDCNIKELTNYCFLKFSPFEDSNPTFSEIHVKITNNSFINTDTTNRIKSDFILFDKTTKIDFLVIIEGCQFTDISLDNYIIHGKSNFRSLQLSNSTITFKDRAKGSNAMYFETNIEQMIFNNCIFERAKVGLSSNININDLL